MKTNFTLFFFLLSLLPGFIYAQPDSVAIADTVKQADMKKDLPLKAERSYHLSASEGTWMSVDVSPDGKSIAFDMLGDLYLLPVTGGKAKRITKGLAYDTHPKFSPDGKKILFISDRSGSENAWVLELGQEEPEPVTKRKNKTFESADWSPDGKYVVTSEGGRMLDLRLYHVDGGSGAELYEDKKKTKKMEPVFSPDGRYIYFSQRSGAWEYNASLPQYQLAVYDRESGEAESLSNRYGSSFAPTLSPDGKWLVYGTRFNTETGLVLRNLESGEETWLAYPVQRDDQESIAPLGVLPAMSFTPDSKRLIVSYGGKLHSVATDGSGETEIPFTVDEQVDMGPQLAFTFPVSDEKEMTVTQIRDLAVSPSGDRIAFTALNRLYVMDLKNKKPKRLTDLEITEAMPAWSPDGKNLAFVAWSDTAGGHLYKVNTTGSGKPVQLTTESALYTEPAWNTAGDRIVFMKGATNDYMNSDGPVAFHMQHEICYIPAAGGKITTIDNARGRHIPHFVRNDDRIYLFHDEKGLVSIRWDGTDEKELVKISGITTYGFTADKNEHQHLPMATEPEQKPSEASLILMAPEGDKAIAQINNEIYTVTVPRFGKEVVEISVADPSSAAFPATKLTEIGGQFPAWSSNGKTVFWTIGNALFTYNLKEAQQMNEALEKKKKEEEKNKKDDEDKEETKEEEGYKPEEMRVIVRVDRDIPEGSILLKNARIITMKDDEVIEKGDILIENNRIVAVGPTGTLKTGKNTEVKDVSGKTIMPGFIDTHSHMWPAWTLHKNQVWIYAANLAYGVTTTRDPQTSTTDVLTYGDMVEAGMMIGPRIYSTGPGVGFWSYNIKDLDQAKNILKQYSDYYNTHYIKMYLVGNRQQRQWVIQAAREQKLMPTTEGALNFKLNMTQILDGYPGHEHSFPIYPIYNDIVNFVAMSKTAYTPTLLVSYGGPWAENYYYETEDVQGDEKLNRFTPKSELDQKSRRRNAGWFMKEEHIFSRHAEFVKHLVEAGGTAGIGSHGQLQGLGYHWEVWSVKSGGISNLNALKVATLLGARALGLEQDLGSLETGKLADLLVLDGNPLEDIRNTNTLQWVMKNGRLYDASSLKELYPESADTPPTYNWHQPEPKDLPGINK